MNDLFGFPLSFGTPWILAGLTVLPLLWWLLRVTPPLARRTLFPPLGLLRGLQDEERFEEPMQRVHRIRQPPVQQCVGDEQVAEVVRDAG